MRKFATLTGLYSLSHFVVDFSCAFLVFSKLYGSNQWLMCLLLYNFFAFAMQMPLGIVADALEKNRYIAALGCVLIMLSPLAVSIPLLFSAVAGFGNGMFHIGAGRDILCRSGKSYTALGIFVSPGAFGLFLGTLCGKGEVLPIITVLFGLLVNAAGIMLVIPVLYDKADKPIRASKKTRVGNSAFVLMLLCLFLVVCLRSYVGVTLELPWRKDEYFALLLVISIVAGKAFGGILADRFGAVKTTFVSLFLCALLFLFYKIPLCGILAVLLFNITMPITLGAIKKLMPNSLGFGFGMLTFGLFIGIIPTFMNMQHILALPYGYAAAAIISAGLLYYGLKEWRHAA